MSFVPIPGDDDDDGGGGSGTVDLTNYSGLNIKLTSTEDSGSGIELVAEGDSTSVTVTAPGATITVETAFGVSVTEVGGVVSLSTAGGSAVQITDDDVVFTDSVGTITLDEIRTIQAATKGFVNHGATAGTARPDFVSVEWLGSVEPTNAIDGDTWIDTSV